VFGVGGTNPGPLINTLASSSRWGKDLNGVVINSAASFNAAVAQMRTPAGHNPSSTSWANTPQWAAVEAALSTTDESAAADAMDGNPNASVASLASIGIVPLAVTQISCKTFDFTVDSPAADPVAYWGERWELYKHQYVLSRWLYVRGIRKVECASRAFDCMVGAARAR
jgi:hypothetical protein